MRVRVLFFGILRDLTGHASEEAEFEGGATVGAVFDRYAQRFPRLGSLGPSVVAARNHEFADRGMALAEGDEIAFLPPVSGGSAAGPAEVREAGHYFALTRSPIDPRAVIARIQTGGDGAVVTFEGTVRNNTNGRSTLCLDYEGYESMALKVMVRIGCELAGAHQVSRIAMVHRLGRMLVGETSVVVIATAPHRRPAFEAALDGINRLKKTVPIWKKEHFADGEVWVEGEWGRDIPVVG
ncbi:MAG TPA: molybdenum cofactor biosynthesis protein MoaE [Bryobacteraceae bacterium]|nr:molybdenum cofactor biosynthesis protein MoaE [Bryobacteraceae bacterium]